MDKDIQKLLEEKAVRVDVGLDPPQPCDQIQTDEDQQQNIQQNASGFDPQSRTFTKC